MIVTIVTYVFRTIFLQNAGVLYGFSVWDGLSTSPMLPTVLPNIDIRICTSLSLPSGMFKYAPQCPGLVEHPRVPILFVGNVVPEALRLVNRYAKAKSDLVRHTTSIIR